MAYAIADEGPAKEHGVGVVAAERLSNIGFL